MKYKIALGIIFLIATPAQAQLPTRTALKLVGKANQNLNNMNALCDFVDDLSTEDLEQLDMSGNKNIQVFKQKYEVPPSQACSLVTPPTPPDSGDSGDEDTDVQRVRRFIQINVPLHHDWSLSKMVKESGHHKNEFSPNEWNELSVFYELRRRYASLPSKPAGPAVSPKPTHGGGSASFPSSGTATKARPAIANKPLSKDKLESLLEGIRQSVENGSNEDVAEILHRSGYNVAKLTRNDIKACHDAHEAATILRDASGESDDSVNQLDAGGMQGWKQWITDELEDDPNIDLNLASRHLNPIDLQTLRTYADEERARLTTVPPVPVPDYPTDEDDDMPPPPPPVPAPEDLTEDTSFDPGDLPPLPAEFSPPQESPAAQPTNLLSEVQQGQKLKPVSPATTNAPAGEPLTSYQKARIVAAMNEAFVGGETDFEGCLTIALNEAGIKRPLSAQEKKYFKDNFDGDEDWS